MITAMGDVMREAYKRNWITTRDGNCAVRIKGSNTIHMTPSGVRKTLICPEMICKVTLGEKVDFHSNMNLNVTGRVGPSVAAWEALSKELAQHTFTNLGIENGIRKFDIVGQRNHGVTAVGKNPWEAFEHIERVEHICQIVLASGIQPPRNEDGKREKLFGII